MQTQKKVRLPRWCCLVAAIIFTSASWSNGKQAWLKYKWGDVLGVPRSDLIVSIAAALGYLIVAGGIWYLWLTYHKRNKTNDNT